MKSDHQATHQHKRVGPVVVLQTTAELAKVLVPSGDEFWVKLSELTEITAGAPAETKTRKKSSKAERPNASANSQYRVVRVA